MSTDQPSTENTTEIEQAASLDTEADQLEEPITEDEVMDDPWAEEVERSKRRPGLLARGRARWRRGWVHYLTHSVPADDDGPENLPTILQGTRGRIIFAVATACVMVLWMIALVAIVF
ncbi:hypothetical protein [Nesterenkonia alkaliphila]|uniref:Uncharacterized protein n=1 Tax=Nesterenkonia alkaliphila TaxID=1463631 RepID=A0A7K1UGW1_9MICC|nr:hypothetical protein [Nesterenkonia alkaliphila]MVT25717.1 hypothetical protein [Nesterenkonia alkaliphila]GFZ85306.1 hypothetical protein GCM10011359_13040 [Nesterenkonia alkaliphila]